VSAGGAGRAVGAQGAFRRCVPPRRLLRAVLLPLLGLHGGRRHERVLPLRDQRGHEDHVPHPLQHPGQWGAGGALSSPPVVSQSPAQPRGGAALRPSCPPRRGSALRAGGGRTRCALFPLCLRPGKQKISGSPKAGGKPARLPFCVIISCGQDGPLPCGRIATKRHEMRRATGSARPSLCQIVFLGSPAPNTCLSLTGLHLLRLLHHLLLPRMLRLPDQEGHQSEESDGHLLVGVPFPCAPHHGGLYVAASPS